MRMFTTLCTLALIPTLAFAQATIKEADKAASGNYVIDPSHASVIFKVNHMGYSNYAGRFNKVDATLKFDAKNLEQSSVEATVFTGSVDVDNDKLEAELISPAAFKSQEIQKATFKSTKLTRISANKAKMDGELTFLGVTKPLSMEVTFNGSGPHPMSKKDMLGFSAVGKLKRSDFGFVQWAPMVGDEVAIQIEAEFSRADK